MRTEQLIRAMAADTERPQPLARVLPAAACSWPPRSSPRSSCRSWGRGPTSARR